MITATQIEAEFGGDYDLLAERSEGFADEFFVRERAINFSRVEERDPAIHGCVEKRRHLLFVFGWAVGKAHTHAKDIAGIVLQLVICAALQSSDAAFPVGRLSPN